MDWINIISNNESVISNIAIIDDSLIVRIRLWNGNERILKFDNYSAFKEKKSIDEEIGDIILQKQSELLEELKKDNEDYIEEMKNMRSFVFMNAWNDRVILEVIAESINIDEK
ncbi:MAG: hypothetical protein HDR22_08590 [Lachnospiraceae bacterium]|nr:hypothetical protein [Lachnospiraceae bacterium]